MTLGRLVLLSSLFGPSLAGCQPTRRHGDAAPAAAAPATSDDLANLPRRAGPRPRATDRSPHRQLDQNAGAAMQAATARCAFGLPDVDERPTMISVPRARALWLRESVSGRAEAFMVGREFAHLHPPDDGSLHVTLSAARAQAAIDAGWAERHPAAMAGPPGNVMIYGPRDDRELRVVCRLVRDAWQFAHIR